MNSPVLEKLKAILAKADPARNPSEAEVRTAMEMAQRLAVRHNLDLAEVQAMVDDTEKAPPLETDRAEVGDPKYTTWRYSHTAIWRVLRECFQIEAVRAGGSRMSLVGEKVDVALATYCWRWLNELFPSLYKAFLKEKGFANSDITRRSYFDGLAEGIIEVNKRVVKDLSKDEADRYAIVLVDKAAVVLSRFKQEFGERETSRDGRAHREDGFARSSGREDGRKVKLNHGLGSGSARGLLD